MPVRTCLACMRKLPKGELVRLGLEPESGCIVADVRGRMEGRGGYVCRGCLPALRLDKRLQRAFRNKAKQLRIAEELLLEE